MKRLKRIPWPVRLFFALASLIVTGLSINPLYHWHINRSLMFATERGDTAEVKRRLSEGADVNTLVTQTLTKPTASIFLKSMLHGKPDRLRRPRTTLLMVAVLSGRLEVARQLLERGARVDERDEFGFTALSMAISIKRPDLVQLLLDHHADPNATNDVGMPPLIWALLLQQNPCAQLLLRAGADPNARDKDGLPALYLAALDSNRTAMGMLLDHKADVNVDYKGCSVLRMAIEQDDGETVKMLLHYGAHPDGKALGGKTLLQFAKSQQHQDIAMLLKHAGATK